MIEYSDDNQTSMFLRLYHHECIIRVYIDGSIQFEGKSIDKEPLKVKFKPFDDEQKVTMIETDQMENNIVFVSDNNVIRVFEVRKLLRNKISI